MLMAAASFLAENPKPTENDIREGLHGNICRCTGYNSIIRAVKAVADGKYEEAANG
jgi:aerobic-type carbon monoxide dehydrogenase small subunit (CoxS/CutS family)